VNEKHRMIIGLLKLFDLCNIALSFLITTAIVVRTQWGVPLAQFLLWRTKIANTAIFVAALCICHVVFQVCGLYRSRRLTASGRELLDILKANTINTVCFLALGYFFSIQMITVAFLAIFWIVSTAVICVARSILRLVATHLRLNGKNLRYMLIIGTNKRALDFAHTITSNRELGYRLLGFIDDPWPGISRVNDAGFEVVSDYEGLAEYLRHNVVDEVALYAPLGSSYRHTSQVASLCEQHGITMRINCDVFGLKATRWRAEEFAGKQYIGTYTGSSELLPQAIKRGIDIAFSSLLLIALSPVLITAAIAIKVTSPGPVFFLQDRLGMNKRLFKIYKFRTMVPNAEKLMAQLEQKNEATGPVFKMKNDPRITPIGKFLRKSSIDELPQLFNVLKGQMSLVGPRPLPVRDYQGFNEDWQRRRFSIKPGITCLWQVNGRSGISFDQWMLLDLQYMDEWSLFLDFKILMKTVPAVLRASGAA